jgi:hypothetical protein
VEDERRRQAVHEGGPGLEVASRRFFGENLERALRDELADEELDGLDA